MWAHQGFYLCIIIIIIIIIIIVVVVVVKSTWKLGVKLLFTSKGKDIKHNTGTFIYLRVQKTKLVAVPSGTLSLTRHSS